VRITVVRSGGFAGLTRTWQVRVEEQRDQESWLGLVRELPWDIRPAPSVSRDRFVYLIRVSRRRITLPEQEVRGPWRELVDRVRDAADGA